MCSKFHVWNTWLTAFLHIQVSIVETEAGVASMGVAAACYYYVESLYRHGSMFMGMVIDPYAHVTFNSSMVCYVIWI